jgi:hypothetical protein
MLLPFLIIYNYAINEAIEIISRVGFKKINSRLPEGEGEKTIQPCFQISSPKPNRQQKPFTTKTSS